MSDPLWKTVYQTDYSWLMVDTTGEHAPMLEIAQEYEREPQPSDEGINCDNCGTPVAFSVDGKWEHADDAEAAELECRGVRMPRYVTRFQLYRFDLDGCQRWTVDDGEGTVTTYVVPRAYRPDWSRPASVYEEWYVKDLGDIARSAGIEGGREGLVSLLCSDDPKDLAWAYEAIGGYWGYDNLDGYPLDLSEGELNERWSKALPSDV